MTWFEKMDLSYSVKRGAAGAVAGGIGLFISTPIEYFKCVAQVNTQGHISYGAVCAQVGCTGIYKGFWATMWRDVPSWAVYFWAYEHYKNKFVTNGSQAN